MIPEAPPDPPELHKILDVFSGIVAFDIGANVGSTAKMLSHRFHRVVALEPADESFDSLLELSQTFTRIIPLQLAASSSEGCIDLVVCEDKIDSGQLVTTDWPEWGKRIETRSVPSITLDSLSDRYGMPDLLKVDVEGHEVSVLEGASRVIKQARPALYLEVHNADLGAKLRKMLDPYYPDLHEVWHPHYRPTDWGARNHYWLVASQQH